MLQNRYYNIFIESYQSVPLAKDISPTQEGEENKG